MFTQELALIVDYSLYYKDYSPATKKQLAEYLEVQINRQIYSLPSPGIWAYTPANIACSRVDLP
jgi:hypothetical protein